MTVAIDFSAYAAKEAAFNERADALLPENKRVLFAALAEAGVSTVVVTFDGCGDSGQIESVTAFSAEDVEVPMPAELIQIPTASFDEDAITTTATTPADAIEALVYDLLRKTHGDWEDNDGAYGEVTFCVAERSITLDHNERYTASTNYQHTF